MSKKYAVEHTNPMLYQEFGEIVKKLIRKLENYCAKGKIKFDIVAPILRSGGIIGSILAVHFEITRLMPIQLKYDYHPTRLKQLLSLPQLLQSIPLAPNILVCETNTNSGDTAKAVFKILKKEMLDAKFYYATVVKVFGSPDVFEGVEKYFWGVQSNENFVSNKKKMEKLKLRPKITIFPWENVEHELRDINAVLAKT